MYMLLRKQGMSYMLSQKLQESYLAGAFLA
jgi:hypothetical protein